MIQTVKLYKYFLIIMIFDLIMLIVNPLTGKQLFHFTYFNFAEMLKVLPPIFILLGLLDVWVPREKIIRYLGEKSGAGGIALSIFLGAAAAGPLYAAFPVASVMAQKGARYGNILVFLGAWSTLKIPMFLFEMSSLGVRFALTRWLINIPGIILMAFIIERILDEKDKAPIYHSAAKS